MNTEDTTTYPTKKKRGRPKIDIAWPETSFTVKDVIESMEMPPSSVLVHLKIKEGIQEGSIKRVGKKSTRVGRPQNVYQLTTAEEKLQQETQPAETGQELEW